MQFRVVAAKGEDPTTPSQFLKLPPIQKLTKEKTTRHLALVEIMSKVHDGPAEAMLGSIDEMGMPMELMYAEAVSENPNVGDTEVWDYTTHSGCPSHACTCSCVRSH
jgi:hypothetical protein